METSPVFELDATCPFGDAMTAHSSAIACCTACVWKGE
jgi:hypothetical protein